GALDRRGDVRAAASGRPAREGELQPQAVVVADGAVEAGVDRGVADEPRRGVDADLRDAGADQVGGPVLLSAGPFDLDHLPRRLEGDVRVATDVHQAVNNHDVVGGEPGLNEVADDLLVLIRTTAEGHGSANCRKQGHFLEHYGKSPRSRRGASSSLTRDGGHISNLESSANEDFATH